MNKSDNDKSIKTKIDANKLHNIIVTILNLAFFIITILVFKLDQKSIIKFMLITEVISFLIFLYKRNLYHFGSLFFMSLTTHLIQRIYYAD